MASGRSKPTTSRQFLAAKEEEDIQNVSMGLAGDSSMNDTFKGFTVQHFDQPEPENPDPTPDRVATMRMRLMQIKGSMDLDDNQNEKIQQNLKPDESEVQPVFRQRTFTIEKGKETFAQRQAASQHTDIAVAAPKQLASHAVSTCPKPKRGTVKRLDYYKPRAAVTAPRLANGTRVPTKTSYKITKDAIKKSLLESLETNEDGARGLSKENVFPRSKAPKPSKIPVKISARPTLENPVFAVNKSAFLMRSKIPVSPRVAQLMQVKTPQ